MPPALITPACSHLRHKQVPATRLDTQRRRVAIRATVAFGNDVIEKHRGQDATEDKESDKDEREENRVSHSEALLHQCPGFHMCNAVLDAFDAHVFTNREHLVAKAAGPHG